MIDPNDMTQKPCGCGGIAAQVITHIDSTGAQMQRARRKGWYCPKCRAWEAAILRETVVEVECMQAK